MMLILSQIPLEEFLQKTDKRRYALDCEYFSMAELISKPDAGKQAFDWILWYTIGCNKPLYVSLISTLYWRKHGGTLVNPNYSVRLTTWKTIPHYAHEYSDGSYKRIPEEQRICSIDELKRIKEAIESHSFKNNPVFSVKIGT